MTEPLRVFIGYDPTEHEAAEVCKASLLDNASVPVLVEYLDQTALRRAGLYPRTSFWHHEQRYDTVDGRPYSTEFSFSRFLVPTLMQYGRNGSSPWAVFCDSDMLWRGDIAELVTGPIHAKRERAVYVVKHNYAPETGTKMRGEMKQEPYFRKNWSSFMLFNTAHTACQMLVPWHLATASGRWLHTFEWCQDNDIGRLDPKWNYLVGHDTKETCNGPLVVHFTSGVPAIPGYEESEFADEWFKYWGKLQ